MTDTAPQSFVADAPAGPVPALLLPTTGCAPLVLLGHGANGRKDHPVFVRLAERMRDTIGVHVLTIDGPAHGERAPAGEGEEQLRASRRVMNDEATVPRMVEDWRTAVASARERVDVGDRPLGYIGFSMGTALGIPTVAGIDEV